MKQKILDALKQGFKNLGLSDEAFERVATFGETFITSEEQIANFVKGAEKILKAEQSAADKVRTELNAKIKALETEKTELEAKLGNPAPTPTPQPEPKPDEPQDMAKIIAAAVAEAVKPLSDKIAAFEGSEKAKGVRAAAETTFKANEYVKKYKDYAEDAWDRALEMFEVGGSKMTAEELSEKAMGYFNKAVARKGVDTSKPFVGNGDPDNTGAPSMEEIMEIYKRSGRIKES